MAEGTDSLFTNWRTGRPQQVDTTGVADSAVTTAKIADANVTTAKIANDAVTYAKLQNISAQFRALGRNSASAGDAEEVTLTQLLDWIGSAAQGDILYRGASSWARLAAGTLGQFLQTQGAAANPQWSGPVTTIASGSLSGASTVIATNIPQYFSYLDLRITGASIDTAARNFLLQISNDNGVSYDTTAGNYALFSFVAAMGVAGLAGGFNHAAAAETANLGVTLCGYQNGPYTKSYGLYRIAGVGDSVNYGIYDANTSAVDALRVIVQGGAGSFDAGTFVLSGAY